MFINSINIPFQSSTKCVDNKLLNLKQHTADKWYPIFRTSHIFFKVYHNFKHKQTIWLRLFFIYSIRFLIILRHVLKAFKQD